ncbi:hypothetical protein GH714_014547 [Hevea brasiliensis]|uniref:Cytochrome P450 n=1 Tax=Hevea brasiliensis TaxID=3981 RepID=A0A6A6KR79_HEVBR|nr:hypothetical protein GH714_014547 [Hevea brasiliensis]
MAMEIYSNSASWAFFCFAVAILSAILLTHKRGHNKNKKKLPPGEMGLPWIGETMEFFKAQRKNRMFEEFVQPRMAKYGKIFKTRLMGSPTIIVNGAEANRFFLSNEFKLVISSWPTTSVQLMGSNSIMEKQGDQHRCLRGLIGNTLSSAGLEVLVSKICKSVELHLEKYWNNSIDGISLYHSTKVLTFTIVFECLLGIKVESGTFSTFERILDGVFAPPLAFPGSRGEITEEEVIDNVVLLVFAAHDTTSFAVAMTFKMIAQHPDCHTLLLREQIEIMKQKTEGDILTLEDARKMKYTWQVARESMRLFPPIFGSFRKAIVDIEFEGFIIPRGWKVLWTTHGTHYNEECFEDPLKFNPSRFEETIPPYVYIPFGGGPRLCAGYQLAKLNILIFVHYVVTRYDWSLIYPDEQITMDPLPFPSHGMPIKLSLSLEYK